MSHGGGDQQNVINKKSGMSALARVAFSSALLLAVCNGEKCPNQDGTANDLTQIEGEDCECNEGLRPLIDTPAQTLQCLPVCELDEEVRRDSCICTEGPNSPTARECTLANPTAPSGADNCTCVDFRCAENDVQYAVIPDPDFPAFPDAPCSCGEDTERLKLDAGGVETSESGKPWAFIKCVLDENDDDENNNDDNGNGQDSAVGKASAVSPIAAAALTSATLALSSQLL